MTKCEYFCDKCGKKIVPANPISQAIFPRYTITKRCDPLTSINIDLCNECMDDLNAWMNRKPLSETTDYP